MYYLIKYPTGNIYIEQSIDLHTFIVLHRVKMVSVFAGFSIGTTHTDMTHKLFILEASESLDEILGEAALLML